MKLMPKPIHQLLAMKRLIAAALVTLVASPALAVDFKTAMEHYLEANIMPWAHEPGIISAIEAQNTLHEGLTGPDIDALDQQWEREIGAADAPLITSVLTNSLSDALRGHVEAAAGAVFELFVMDAHGLNVASSAQTSDYWQGDEAKFTDTYGKGAGAVHFGEVEFDESSQAYQAQISMTITDPSTGAPIGAITVGINADHLM